jgi:hypothetical protein
VNPSGQVSRHEQLGLDVRRMPNKCAVLGPRAPSAHIRLTRFNESEAIERKERPFVAYL